jgi:hypothetical protein
MKHDNSKKPHFWNQRNKLHLNVRTRRQSTSQHPDLLPSVADSSILFHHASAGIGGFNERSVTKGISTSNLIPFSAAP